jgi:hypothetical protein
MSRSPVVLDALSDVDEALVRLPLLTRRALTAAFAEQRDKGTETVEVWSALLLLFGHTSPPILLGSPKSSSGRSETCSTTRAFSPFLSRLSPELVPPLGARSVRASRPTSRRPPRFITR